MSRPHHVSTESFPGSFGGLNQLDYLIIYLDKVEFDDIAYAIEKTTEYPFDIKDDLLRSFSCKYDFEYESENISGKLIRYEFDKEIPRIGHTIEFIYLIDCGSYVQYIYIEDGLYRFTNDPFFENTGVVKLERTIEEESNIKYTLNVDTTALVSYLEEPLHEIVTEQFLLKDSYYELEEIPVQYEEKYLLFFHETSTCDQVEYDTIFEQVLVKEGAFRYEILPATLETITEYRVIQNKFEGELFYERQPLDSLMITLKGEYNEIEGVQVLPGCSDFEFFDCIDVHFNTIPSKDTVLYNVYENCSDGYESAGKYCYSNIGTVPYRFALREYEKLKTTATAHKEEIPNEYSTIQLIRITNKEELDSNCLEIVWDSISLLEVAVLASVEETLISAEYETLQYNYYQDGGKIEVVEGNPSFNFQILSIHGGSYEFTNVVSQVLKENRACYLLTIQRRLIEVGYLDENHISSIQSFHSALANYQIDNELPLGVIDAELMEALDIKFGF